MRDDWNPELIEAWNNYQTAQEAVLKAQLAERRARVDYDRCREVHIVTIENAEKAHMALRMLQPTTDSYTVEDFPQWVDNEGIQDGPV